MDNRKFILYHKVISSEFNKLLNELDFLNVIDKDNPSEYSDLIGPFLAELQVNRDKEKLEEFVSNYIYRVYGYSLKNVDFFVKKMLKFWNEIDQIIICRKYGTTFTSVSPNSKIGIAKNIKDTLYPLNGLRHKPENGTCGWYIWRGVELSTDKDFFSPLHVAHLKEYCPEITEYLGLPPGWRFLITPNQIEVWFDEKLV